MTQVPQSARSTARCRLPVVAAPRSIVTRSRVPSAASTHPFHRTPPTSTSATPSALGRSCASRSALRQPGKDRRVRDPGPSLWCPAGVRRPLANWSRGCLGTRADFDELMDEAFTPGSPAHLEGQRVGALVQELKQNLKQERKAANSAKVEGRLGYQQAPNAGRSVRFEGGPPAHGGGRDLAGTRSGLVDAAATAGAAVAGAAASRHTATAAMETGRGAAAPSASSSDGARRGSRPPMGGVAGSKKIPPTWPTSRRPLPRWHARRRLRPRPDGAYGEPGFDDSPGEPGSQIQVIMTAVGNQPTWIFS